MVKNYGGNKSKKQGRKHIQEALERSQEKTRLKRVEEENEIYMAVTKMLGGSICEVMNNEEKKYHCIIRRNFRGRHKRDNMVSVGNWVLVGLRSWETQSSGIPKCDMLEVYNNTADIQYILQNHKWYVNRLPLVENSLDYGLELEDKKESIFMDTGEYQENKEVQGYMDAILEPNDNHKQGEQVDFDIDLI